MASSYHPDHYYQHESHESRGDEQVAEGKSGERSSSASHSRLEMSANVKAALACTPPRTRSGTRSYLVPWPKIVVATTFAIVYIRIYTIALWQLNSAYRLLPSRSFAERQPSRCADKFSARRVGKHPDFTCHLRPNVSPSRKRRGFWHSASVAFGNECHRDAVWACRLAFEARSRCALKLEQNECPF
jgi:hypothetical protein